MLKLFPCLRIPTMAPSLLGLLLPRGSPTTAVLFLVIMYLQGTRGLSALGRLSACSSRVTWWAGAHRPLCRAASADRVGPVIRPPSASPSRSIALFIYAQLTADTARWVVVVGSLVNGLRRQARFLPRQHLGP